MNILQRVVDSRWETNLTFPCPNCEDSTWYALSEAGETASSLMYQRRPADKRNNNRDRDPRAEWGQCGYMIATAINNESFEPVARILDLPPTSAYCQTVESLSIALDYEAQGFHNEAILNLASALDSWVDFCTLNGWDAEALIDETCAAFEAKHAPKVTA